MNRRPALLHSRLLLNQREAAECCGVSVPYFKAHFHIQPVEIGNKLLFAVKDIEIFVDQHKPDQQKTDWLGKLDEGARERA